jgi:hypothetical protein
MRSIVLALTGVLLTTSCGTDPNVFHVGCQQVDGFDVGSGLTPSISWSPGCRVASLGVYEGVPVGPGDVPPLPGTLPGLTTGARMWQITSPASAGNLLEPALRYGDRPADAIEDTPALPRLQWIGQFRP